MELNRRRVLTILLLVAWSVAAWILFSRWWTAAKFFSINTNSVMRWNMSQADEDGGSQNVAKMRDSSAVRNNAQFVFVPVLGDELALRMDKTLEANGSSALKGNNGKKKINTAGMNRQQSWNFFHRLIVNGELDFRDVAEYSLDDYLSPMDQEILADGPPLDPSTAASPDTSRLELVGPREMGKVKVGENATVHVILRDTKGRPVFTGGHVIRVWMVGKGKVKRSAAVDVTDLRNGTYVATLPVLWPGPIEVRASLQRPREFRWGMLSLFKNMKTVLQILANFVSGPKEEATLCSFIPVVPGYPEVCNLTSLNSNLPWYCGRPSTPGLKCRDWIHTHQSFIPIKGPEGDIVRPYFTHVTCGKRKLHQTIQLTAIQGPEQKTPRADPKICQPLTPRETWEAPAPRGFWEGSQWRPLVGCPLPQLKRSTVLECLHDTQFIAVGDSNARFVVERMQSYAGCTKGASGTIGQRYVPMVFYCPEHMLHLSWNPHAFPYCSSVWSEITMKQSPGFVLDTLPTNGSYVVLIHLYMHFAVHHIYSYILQVRDAARGVRDLMKRNPTAKVFIRGPHALNYKIVCFQSDLHALRTLAILQREFRDLRDHVVFLNMMDMTVANGNCDLHPNDHVVRTVCQMIVSFVCPAK